MMEKTVHWGILGLGNIAAKFAEGLLSVPDAGIAACASRSREKREAFSRKFGIPRQHVSYADLAADPGVDAIYIATPHAFHKENTLLCLDAGKAVLCEKPFALNVREAGAMIARAREKGVFLMEAMWTRFMPHIAEMRRLVDAGAIGDPRLWRADFCFRADVDPESRLFNPKLGGGGLLDVGVYPVNFASYFLGPVREVKAVAGLGATGVDESMSIATRHDGDRLGSLACAIRVGMPNAAALYGAEGSLQIHERWVRPSRLTLRTGDRIEEITPEAVGNGYNYEAAEVHRCLRAGLRESPVMPWAETLSIMETLDDIRRQIGLAYPGE